MVLKDNPVMPLRFPWVDKSQPQYLNQQARWWDHTPPEGEYASFKRIIKLGRYVDYPALRVFNFPAMCGGELEFKALLEKKEGEKADLFHRQQKVECYNVEYPGMGTRKDEAVIDDFHELVKTICDDLEPFAKIGGCVYVGHGIGAKILYECIYQLWERGVRNPNHLILSCEAAPFVDDPDITFDVDNDEEVMKFWKSARPDIAEMPDDEAEALLPLLKAEAKMKTVTLPQRQFGTPITVCVAENMGGGLTHEACDRWREISVHEKYKFEVFEGGDRNYLFQEEFREKFRTMYHETMMDSYMYVPPKHQWRTTKLSREREEKARLAKEAAEGKGNEGGNEDVADKGVEAPKEEAAPVERA